MTKRQLEEWEKIRPIGLWRYTLVYWVMAWGFTVAGLMILLLYAIAKNKSALFPWAFIFYLLCPLGGFIGGLLCWRMNEEARRKSKES